MSGAIKRKLLLAFNRPRFGANIDEKGEIRIRRRSAIGPVSGRLGRRQVRGVASVPKSGMICVHTAPLRVRQTSAKYNEPGGWPTVRCIASGGPFLCLRGLSPDCGSSLQRFLPGYGLTSSYPGRRKFPSQPQAATTVCSAGPNPLALDNLSSAGKEAEKT